MNGSLATDGLLTRTAGTMSSNMNAAADALSPSAANNTNTNNISSAASANVVRQVEDYNHILNSIGLPNYGTIKSLFSPGEGATPADTMPAIQVSFELFETVQNRFAATKLTLERTKADLLLRNQQYSALQGTLQTLKEEFAVLQKRAAESEERNTAFNQLVARQEVSLEQLRREVGQARTEIELVQEKLTRREEELQESQNKVTEGLVTISQKDAAITALRRELGKLGRFHRKNSGSANPNDPNRAAGEEYSAEALQSIAAEVEARSQEARMKLTLANLEAKLRRTEQEKEVVLEQHEKYRRHVERVVAVYETQCMQLHDAMAQHKCVRTPYYLSSAYYAPLLHPEDEEEDDDNIDINNNNNNNNVTRKTGGNDDDGDDEKAPFRSFQALTFETRRLLDRVAKISVDRSSAMKDELEDCAAAYRKALEANTELVGFLGTFESELTTQRHTLPEVREEWAKARIPFFVSKVAHELQESVTALGKSFVQLLQRENEYRQSLAQRMQTSTGAGGGRSGSNSTAGTTTRHNSLTVPLTVKAFANAATMTMRVRKISQAVQVIPDELAPGEDAATREAHDDDATAAEGEHGGYGDHVSNEGNDENVHKPRDSVQGQEMGSVASRTSSKRAGLPREETKRASSTRLSHSDGRQTPQNPLGRATASSAASTNSHKNANNNNSTARPPLPRHSPPGSRITSANSHLSYASFVDQNEAVLATARKSRSMHDPSGLHEDNDVSDENVSVSEDGEGEEEESIVHDVIHVELPFTCPHCAHLITRDDLVPIAGLSASPEAALLTPDATNAALLSTLPYRAPEGGSAGKRRSTAHDKGHASLTAAEDGSGEEGEEGEAAAADQQHTLHTEEEEDERATSHGSLGDAEGKGKKRKKKGSREAKSLSRSSSLQAGSVSHVNATTTSVTSPSKAADHNTSTKKKSSTSSVARHESEAGAGAKERLPRSERGASKSEKRFSNSLSTNATSVAAMHSRTSRSKSSLASQRVSMTAEGRRASSVRTHAELDRSAAEKERSLSRGSTSQAMHEMAGTASPSEHSTHAPAAGGGAEVRKLSRATGPATSRHSSDARHDDAQDTPHSAAESTQAEAERMRAAQETMAQLRAAVQRYEAEQARLRQLHETAEHVATQTEFTWDEVYGAGRKAQGGTNKQGVGEEGAHGRQAAPQEGEEEDEKTAGTRAPSNLTARKNAPGEQPLPLSKADQQAQAADRLPPVRPVMSGGSQTTTAPPSPNDLRSPAASSITNAHGSNRAEEEGGEGKGEEDMAMSEAGNGSPRQPASTTGGSQTARAAPAQRTIITTTAAKSTTARTGTQKANAAAQARRVAPPVLPSVTTATATTVAGAGQTAGQGAAQTAATWPQPPMSQQQQQQRAGAGRLGTSPSPSHGTTKHTTQAAYNRHASPTSVSTGRAMNPAQPWHTSSQATQSAAIPHGAAEAYAMDWAMGGPQAFVSSVEQRTIRRGRVRPALQGLHLSEGRAYGFNVAAARLNPSHTTNSGGAHDAVMMLPGLQVRGLQQQTQQQQQQQPQAMYGNRPAPLSRHHTGHATPQPLPIARHFIRLSGDDQPFAATTDDAANTEEPHWANTSMTISTLHHNPLSSAACPQPPSSSSAHRYSTHTFEFAGLNGGAQDASSRKDVVERYERYVLQQLLRRRFSDRPTSRQAFRSSLNMLFHMPYLHPTTGANATSHTPHPASASAPLSLSSDGPSLSRLPGQTPPSSAAMAHGVSIFPVHGPTANATPGRDERGSLELTLPGVVVPSLMMTGHQIGSKPWSYGHLGNTQVARTMRPRRWSGERGGGHRGRRLRYPHRHQPSPLTYANTRPARQPSPPHTTSSGLTPMMTALPLTHAPPTMGPRPPSTTVRPAAVTMTLMPQSSSVTPPAPRGFSPLQVLRRRVSPLLARRDPYVRRVKHTSTYMPLHMRPASRPRSTGFGRPQQPQQQKPQPQPQQQQSGFGGLQGQGMMH